MRNESEQGPKRRRMNRFAAILLSAVLILSTVLVNYVNSESFQRALAEGSENAMNRIFALLRGANSNPQTFDEYEQLANIAIAQEQYEEALPYLDECIDLSDPADAAALATLWTRKGSLYALLSRHEEAADCLGNALAYDPNMTQALVLRAQIYIEQGAFELATDDLEAYLVNEPSDASIWAALAQLYEALQRYDRARACYERAMALGGGDAATLLNRARSSYLMGNYDEAINDYDTYLATAGDSGGTARFLRAVCLLQMARYEEAMGDFLAAMEDGYPDTALCYEQLSICAYALERHEEAISYAEASLAENSEQTSLDALYQRMGVSKMTLGRYDEAVADLTESIAINAALDGSFYYRGVCNLAREAYGEAIADFTKSIEMGFLEQFCYYNRGVCYVQLMDYENALDDMEQVLTIGEDPELLSGARDVLWQMAQYYLNNPQPEATAPPEIPPGEPPGEAEDDPVAA